MSSARIPASKLVEYCLARSSAERTKIIRSCIDPPEFLFRYGDVQKAIAKSLLQNNFEPLKELQARYLAIVPQNEQDAIRISNAIACVKKSEFLFRAEELEGHTFARAPTKKSELVVEGVHVVVSPQCLILDRLNGLNKVGALKVYTSKTKPLSQEAALLLGSLLHWQLDAFRTPPLEIEPTLCLVADVFEQRVFRASSTFKRRRIALLHACQEINDRWPTIQRRVVAGSESKRGTG